MLQPPRCLIYVDTRDTAQSASFRSAERSERCILCLVADRSTDSRLEKLWTILQIPYVFRPYWFGLICVIVFFLSSLSTSALEIRNNCAAPRR